MITKLNGGDKQIIMNITKERCKYYVSTLQELIQWADIIAKSRTPLEIVAFWPSEEGHTLSEKIVKRGKYKI